MYSDWRWSLRVACLLRVLTGGSIPDKYYDGAFFVFQQQAEETPNILKSELFKSNSDEMLSYDNSPFPDESNEYLSNGEHIERTIPVNKDSRVPSSDFISAEYSAENLVYVIPANEDPNVPKSDVLNVDPLTLATWDDDKNSREHMLKVKNKAWNKSPSSHASKHDPYRNYRYTRSEAINRVIPANEYHQTPSRGTFFAEHSGENPQYVLPANEDPGVPRSDVLFVDPLTLEVLHVDQSPWSQEETVEEFSSEEHQHDVKVFDPDVYCGDKIYNPRIQICCKLPNSKTAVWDNPNRLRMGCCGIRAYDTDTQWCCEGSTRIVPAKFREGNGCCGPQGLPFHYLQHKCCPGNDKSYLVPIPRSDKIGSSAAYSCCSIKNSSQPPKLYKDINQVCCNGVVSPLLGRGTVCCGERPYLLRSSSCCANKFVYNATSDVACCRKKSLYNSRTHVCCNSGAILKPSPSDNGCCHNMPFNPKAFKCCLDWKTGREELSPIKFLFESCCGGTTYNTQEEICCGSKVVSRKKKYLPVCTMNIARHNMQVDVEVK